MPGLRSLVARRRSTLASPQYSSSSRTPPPPSTSSTFYNAQKIERRCNSLPGQANLDSYEVNEGPRLVGPFINGQSVLNGVSNGSFYDSRQNIGVEKQKEKTSESLEPVRPSSSENLLPPSASSSNNNSSNSELRCNSGLVNGKAAMEIESTLARRGVTVVRRMVDTDDNVKNTKKDVMLYPLKDSVITANPLIAKETDNFRSEEIPKHPSVIPPPSVPSNFVNPSGQPKLPVTSRENEQPSNLAREFYKPPQTNNLYRESDKSVSETQRGASQSRTLSNYETPISASSRYTSQSVTANHDPSIIERSQRLIAQSYYNQLAYQHNVKDLGPAKPADCRSISESSYVNTQGPLKTNSSEMSAPLGSSSLPYRTVAQSSPQPRSANYQPSKVPVRGAQFGEASLSPLSKSSEVSPQPRSADMSPYSRSAEASPASRTAQVSPHSRSSQISPMSRSVKASPQSRSTEVSPQSRAQPSPLMRSGDVSPKSRYPVLSPQSGSVESQQSRPSGHHPSQSVPAANPSPLQSVGHSHLLSSSERQLAQTASMSHASQVLPGGSLHQQGTPPGRLPSSSSVPGFPNAPAADFLGRSVPGMFPSYNSSDVLSSQSNAVGFPAQLNSGSFGMHSNSGNFLSQGNNVPFSTPSLGFSQENATSQFSGLNVPAGMVSNANAMGFGNLANCGGFSLHEISGLYGSHSNPGVYNIHNNSGDLRHANTSGVLNYVASRDFSMHTAYRDFQSYSGSNQVNNQVRSQEVSAHDQRDVISNLGSRDASLQNCNQVMGVHQNARDTSSLGSMGREVQLHQNARDTSSLGSMGREVQLHQNARDTSSLGSMGREVQLHQNARDTSSLGSMGREVQLHQNYGEQQMQPGYREQPLFQRSSSDVASLSNNRDAAVRQNFRDTAASSLYKSGALSNTYRNSTSDGSIRNNPAPTSYRDNSSLSGPAEYQSSDARTSNLLSGYRDQQSVLPSYRNQDAANNFASATPVASGYRNPNTHPSDREQNLPNYRDLVNHASPTEQAVRIPSYQDSMNSSTTRNTIHANHANFPSTVSHASPETLSSQYRDAINHASPVERVPVYGENVSLGSSRDMLPGFQLRSPTVTGEQQEMQSYRNAVNHTSPRDQVMQGYQRSVSHTSPRDHSLPAYKENVNQGIPVEQNIPSYHGSMDHSSPREQAYPGIQRDRNHGYRESSSHKSPRQSLPGFGEVVEHTSPREALSGYGENVEHPSPSQQVIQGFKESMEYNRSMRETVECCVTDDLSFKRGMSEVGPAYSGSVDPTQSHKAMSANNYGELQGLQNFRVQHRSSDEFGGTPSEKKTAVLPSFTESFENPSHNKLCMAKSSLYKGARDLEFYEDPRAHVTPVECERYCEDVSYEKLASCSSDRVLQENAADKTPGYDVRNSPECEETYTESFYRSPYRQEGTEQTPEQFNLVKCTNEDVAEGVTDLDSTSGADLSRREEVVDAKEDEDMSPNTLESSKTNHGASPEMISNQSEKPPEHSDMQQQSHERLEPAVPDASPSKSVGASSSEESPEKAERGESSGKSSLGASPSSQERIVIKMKLLHSKPGDEEECKYLGSNESGSDKGDYVRYPMVKYTRWTIDSIINGREDGAAEVLSPGTIKKENGEEEEEEELSEDQSSPPESPKKVRKHRSCEVLGGSKITEFDTNKNLMMKPLKITITNPLRARVSSSESVDTQLPSVKAEKGNAAVKQEPDGQPTDFGSPDAYKPERGSREVSSLRKVRKEREKEVRSPTLSPSIESYVSPSSASRATRACRKSSSRRISLSEDFASVPRDATDFGCGSTPVIKKCSIVIKRIYTEDKSSCYSSQLCDKNAKAKHVLDIKPCVEIIEEERPKLVEERRPKRKAAIEANERRHKSLRSFDRTLELFNSFNSEKVPYNGPITSKTLLLVPFVTSDMPLVKTPAVDVPTGETPDITMSSEKTPTGPLPSAKPPDVTVPLAKTITVAEQKSELSDQQSKLPEQKSELSDQKTELSNQKSELSDQKSELSDQKSELSEQKILLEQKSKLSEQKCKLSEQKNKLSEQKNKLPLCSVLVCDIFMNRRIDKMTCPGCSRKYNSSDSVQVNLNKMIMSLMCCRCHWEVVKHIKPHEVEALQPR